MITALKMNRYKRIFAPFFSLKQMWIAKKTINMMVGISAG